MFRSLGIQILFNFGSQTLNKTRYYKSSLFKREWQSDKILNMKSMPSVADLRRRSTPSLSLSLNSAIWYDSLWATNPKNFQIAHLKREFFLDDAALFFENQT